MIAQRDGWRAAAALEEMRALIDSHRGEMTRPGSPPVRQLVVARRAVAGFDAERRDAARRQGPSRRTRTASRDGALPGR
jgi:hypothetical protein